MTHHRPTEHAGYLLVIIHVSHRQQSRAFKVTGADWRSRDVTSLATRHRPRQRPEPEVGRVTARDRKSLMCSITSRHCLTTDKTTHTHTHTSTISVVLLTTLPPLLHSLPSLLFIHFPKSFEGNSSWSSHYLMNKAAVFPTLQWHNFQHFRIKEVKIICFWHLCTRTVLIFSIYWCNDSWTWLIGLVSRWDMNSANG